MAESPTDTDGVPQSRAKEIEEILRRFWPSGATPPFDEEECRVLAEMYSLGVGSRTVSESARRLGWTLARAKAAYERALERLLDGIARDLDL